VGGGALLYLPGLPPMQRLLQWLACAGSQASTHSSRIGSRSKASDIYAGVMVSNVYGDLANGFLNVQNIDPAAGIRARF
jgi:hypothetical protein